MNNREKIDLIDDKIRQLFEERMAIVKEIKEYKKAHNLPILDENREKEILKKSNLVKEEYRKYYEDFMHNVLRISKEYQNE